MKTIFDEAFIYRVQLSKNWRNDLKSLMNDEKIDIIQDAIVTAGFTHCEGYDILASIDSFLKNAPHNGNFRFTQNGVPCNISTYITDGHLVVEVWAVEKPKEYSSYRGEGFSGETRGVGYEVTVDGSGLPSAMIDKIVSLFKENGFDVTREALIHNHEAWCDDFKSMYTDKKRGYSLFTPCRHNKLYFSAFPVRDSDETYIA